MIRVKICNETVVQDSLLRSPMRGTRMASRWRVASCIAIRVVAMFVAAMVGIVGIAESSSAQTGRLTVHTHEMATATKTAQAGLQTLDGQPTTFEDDGFTLCPKAEPWKSQGCYNILDKEIVYVPQQCVGTRRCPLLIFSNAPWEAYTLMADKHGILLANIKESSNLSQPAAFSQKIQKILQTFAVDPDKIAIGGRCATGGQTVDYAAQNLDVFSRILDGTPETGDPPVKGPNQSNEYFIATGLTEGTADLWLIQKLRDRGYTVKYTQQFRGHTHTYEEYNFFGRWLQESWTIPDPAARPAPRSLGTPPLLTTDILAKMTAFWTQFQKEPDSIRIDGRQPFVGEVDVPVGKVKVSTLMVDMPALAARYPSVAAAFKAANLTPQEHETYRVALASAKVYNSALGSAKGMSADSVRSSLGTDPIVVKNSAFMSAHPDEATALEATDMWTTP